MSPPFGQSLISVCLGAVSAWTPSNLSGILEWWQMGLDYSGPNWLGQFAGHDLAQATPALEGTVISPDATLGNLTTLRLNGTSQYRRCTTIARPAPSVADTTITIVGKQRSWQSTGTWIANGPGTLRITQQSVTPEIAIANSGGPVNLNDAGTLNTWRRVEAFFSNTIADSVHVGPKTVHGTSAGNNASTRITLGASDGLGATSYGAIDAWLIVYASGALSVAEASALDWYIQSKTGPIAGLF